MVKTDRFEEVLGQIRGSVKSGAALRQEAMQCLDRLDGYDWSGIYRLEGDELVLDEYVGAPTDHTRIPVGRGICGTAVSEDKNQVIADVSQSENYLSCSIHTKSEIVVLIKRGGETLGQIDIDGHALGTFDRDDEVFLEKLGEILAERWA